MLIANRQPDWEFQSDHEHTTVVCRGWFVLTHLAAAYAQTVLLAGCSQPRHLLRASYALIAWDHNTNRYTLGVLQSSLGRCLRIGYTFRVLQMSFQTLLAV